MIQHADVILDYTWHNMSAGEFDPEDINSNSIIIPLSEDQHYYISDVVSDLWKEILNDAIPECSTLQLHVYRTIFSVKFRQYTTWTYCGWEYDVDWEIELISHQDTGMTYDEWEKSVYVQPTKEDNMVQLV